MTHDQYMIAAAAAAWATAAYFLGYALGFIQARRRESEQRDTSH